MIRSGSSSAARSEAIWVTTLNVVRECEDCRLDRLDERFARRAGGQCRAEPVQAGVVVREEQIVFGREVPVERAQRDTGVRRDLFGRRVLHALIEEAEQGGASQRFTGALTAHGLRRPDHAGTVQEVMSILT